MPFVASSVAVKLVVFAVPVFLSAKLTITVSPGSINPLAGEQVSPASVVLSITTTGAAGMIEKFVLDMSKKIFPTASTLTRASEFVIFGNMMDCAPVFGALAASTIGNDTPRLVERRMLTFVV